MINRTRDQVVGFSIATVATALSYGLLTYFHGEVSTGQLLFWEVLAVFTQYWGTYLCDTQTRWNYPINFVSVAAFAVTFYLSNLLASMWLNIYLIIPIFIGWFLWRKDTNTRAVTLVSLNQWIVFAVLTAVFYVGAFIINNKLGGSNAPLDTAILVLSILGQFLLDTKKLESWIVWLAVDVIAVPLYWSQDLKFLSIQMGLLGINCVYGMYCWWKTYKDQKFYEIFKQKKGSVTDDFDWVTYNGY